MILSDSPTRRSTSAAFVCAASLGCFLTKVSANVIFRSTARCGSSLALKNNADIVTQLRSCGLAGPADLVAANFDLAGLDRRISSGRLGTAQLPMVF